MLLLQPDDLSQKLLINLAQYLRRDLGEDIGAVRIVEVPDDIFEGGIVKDKCAGQAVRQLRPIPLLLEVEDARVVALVCFPEDLHQTGIDSVLLQQCLEPPVLLNGPILTDAQEQQPVDGPLNSEVQIALAELGIALGQVPGKSLPPRRDLIQQGGVHPFVAPLLRYGLYESLQRASQHRLLGKEGGDLIPALHILIVLQIDEPALARLVGLIGLGTAVVDRKLLEVGENG